jgi:hypothetical protein
MTPNHLLRPPLPLGSYAHFLLSSTLHSWISRFILFHYTGWMSTGGYDLPPNINFLQKESKCLFKPLKILPNLKENFTRLYDIFPDRMWPSPGGQSSSWGYKQHFRVRETPGRAKTLPEKWHWVLISVLLFSLPHSFTWSHQLQDPGDLGYSSFTPFQSHMRGALGWAELRFVHEQGIFLTYWCWLLKFDLFPWWLWKKFCYKQEYSWVYASKSQLRQQKTKGF